MGDFPIIKNTFGFAEMYEWADIPEIKFGRFVQFSNEKDKTHCIKYATDADKIIGVSTINSCIISDNPEEWFLKYAFNEYGDGYFQKKQIAVAEKQYDDINELSYIKTSSKEVYAPLINDFFDPDKTYIPRYNRQEWSRVNLLGKCIVEDNGQCVAGEYCTLYQGNNKEKEGTAIPANDTDNNKWYVLNRVSEKTIFILFK